MHKDFSYISDITDGVEAFPFVIQGSDEAGRGPLAGPVVASTVSIFFDSFEAIKKVRQILTEWKAFGVNDSKKLSSAKRKEILFHCGISGFHSTLEEVAGEIGEGEKYTLWSTENVTVQFKIVSKSASYIDQYNILNASLHAMWESGVDLNGAGKNGMWFFDGNRVPKNGERRLKLIPIVKGDSKMILIGLASILAKEYRDFLMTKFAEEYPQYGFDKHAGYPTEAHRAALKIFGPSPIHRKTYRGVT